MKIKKKLHELYLYELEGDIDKVVKDLNELKEAYPGFERYYFEEKSDWGDDKFLSLLGEREATPQEQQAQLEIDALRAEEDRKNKV